jgi:hypothetical protein
MRDYTGYVISGLFVLFIALCAVQASTIDDLNSRIDSMKIHAEVTDVAFALLQVRYEDLLVEAAAHVPCPEPEHRVTVPTFGGGSTVQFR